MNDNTASEATDDIELLDLVLVVTENLKLVIFGPLLAGLCALGIGMAIPAKNESVFTLHADALTETQVVAASVLDTVIEKLDLKGDNRIEIAREKLRGRIAVKSNRTEKMITITVSHRTPESAQAVATALLQQIFEASKPKGFSRDQLLAQTLQAEKRLKETDGMLTQLASRIEGANFNRGSSDAVQGYAELQNVHARTQSQLNDARSKLEGLTLSSVVQMPTLVRDAKGKRVLWLSLATGFATALILLIYVFFYRQFKHLSQNPIDSGKLLRIKKALGLEK